MDSKENGEKLILLINGLLNTTITPKLGVQKGARFFLVCRHVMYSLAYNPSFPVRTEELRHPARMLDSFEFTGFWNWLLCSRSPWQRWKPISNYHCYHGIYPTLFQFILELSFSVAFDLPVSHWLIDNCLAGSLVCLDTNAVEGLPLSKKSL